MSTQVAVWGKKEKDASEVREEISTFILPGLSGDRRGDRWATEANLVLAAPSMLNL